MKYEVIVIQKCPNSGCENYDKEQKSSYTVQDNPSYSMCKCEYCSSDLIFVKGKLKTINYDENDNSVVISEPEYATKEDLDNAINGI